MVLDLSYSQIRTWKRCKKRWSYSYEHKLVPLGRVKPIELGRYGHFLLEKYYQGGDIEEASQEYWDKETKDMLLEERSEFVDVREQAERLVYNYIEHYKEDGWKVHAVEEGFRVNIPTNTSNPSRSYLRGIIDLVVEDELGELWLVDHKFTSLDLEIYEEGLVLDEQANYYLWALHEMLESAGISGIIFNLIRTKEPTVPRLLKNGSLSKAKNIDTNRDTYYKAILDNGLDPRDYQDMLEHVEHTERPFFKRHKVYRTAGEIELVGEELYDVSKDIRTGGRFKNATRDCTWDCPFRELCIMDSKLLDTEFYKDQNFDRK